MTQARVLIFAVLLAATAALAPAGAQQPSLPYDLLMTRDQAVALIEAWNTGADHVPGELLVRFRTGVPRSVQARAVSVLRRADFAGARVIGDAMLLRAEGEPNMRLAAEILARQPEVEWAQPNYLRRPQSVPNDPRYPDQWNLDQIDMPRAWDINPGASASVTVAVIDSGTTTEASSAEHPIWIGSRAETVIVPFAPPPDIAAGRLRTGRDFVFWNGPVIDMTGHGTAVAHVLLAETNNAFGPAGIAYAARLLPLKVCVGYWDLQILQTASGIPGELDPQVTGGCSSAAIAAAVRFAADSDAKVINLSIGGVTPSPAEQQAIQYAVGRGAFVVAAVGNLFEFGNPVTYPAAYAAQINGAVSVGSVGRSRRRAGDSGTGAHVELVAPGGDFDDGGTLFGGIMSMTTDSRVFHPLFTRRPRFDRYIEIGATGTSLAAPHVAGVAALLYSQGITNPAAIEAALEKSATDLGTPGRDNEYGYGLINARAALRGMGLAK